MEPTPSTHIITQKMEELKALWAKHGQDHVLKWVDTLSDNEKLTFLEDVQQVDVAEVSKIYKDTVTYEGTR
jgi:hypothetical protein